MDMFRIQILIKEGKLLTSTNVDQENTFLQVGVYKPNNRKIGSGDANTYPSFAISIEELATLIGGGGSAFQYEIGQYVASEGGVIAHRWLSTSAFGTPTAGTVQNYLVLDTNDLNNSSQWASVAVDIPNVESTWDGNTNTANMIAAGAGSGITAGTAAVLCNNSANNGKTDWYLPALDELSKVWDNRWEIAQGITVASGTQLIYDYWTSTESSPSIAFTFNFQTAQPSIFGKFNNKFVRAVRRFSI